MEVRQRRLTAAQATFVEVLSADPKQNGSAAAVAAGYSPKSAARIAHELRHDPKYVHVQEALVARGRERTNAVVSDDDLIQRTAQLAMLDHRKIVKVVRRENGVDLEITPGDELFPEQAALIKGYKVFAGPYGSTINIDFHDQAGMLKTMLQVRGLLKNNINLEAQISLVEAQQSLESKLASLAAPACEDGLDPELESGGTEGAGA